MIGGPASEGSVPGNRRAAPVTAATSRASPTSDEGVAAVRLDVDVEDDVAVELGQGDAERRVRRQDQDPVGVAGQVQLVARAEHPVADDAHLLGPLDPPVAGQDRAREGDRHALAGGDVRRSADDLERLARRRG